jgi:hypothetical protein
MSAMVIETPIKTPQAMQEQCQPGAARLKNGLALAHVRAKLAGYG